MILNNLLFKLAKRFLTYSQVSNFYHDKKFLHDKEYEKENRIIKDHAEKEILQFLKDKGANFQTELERQDFIAIKIDDNNHLIPYMSYTLFREIK